MFKLGDNHNVKFVNIKITNFNISLQNGQKKNTEFQIYLKANFVLYSSGEFSRGLTIEFFPVLLIFILTYLGVCIELELIDLFDSSELQ